MALPSIQETNDTLENIEFNQELTVEGITKMKEILSDINKTIYESYILMIDQLDLQKSQLFAEKERLDEERRKSKRQEGAGVKMKEILSDIKKTIYESYILMIDQLDLQKSQLFAEKERLDEERRKSKRQEGPVGRGPVVPVKDDSPFNRDNAEGGLFGDLATAAVGGQVGAAATSIGTAIGAALLGESGIAGLKKGLGIAKVVGGRLFKGGFYGVIGYAIGTTAVDLAASLVDDPELKKKIKEEGQQAVDYASLGASIGFMLFGPPGALVGGLLGIAVSLFDDLLEWIYGEGDKQVQQWKKEREKKEAEVTAQAEEFADLTSSSSKTELTRDLTRKAQAGVDVNEPGLFQPRMIMERIQDRTGLGPREITDEMKAKELEDVKREYIRLQNEYKSGNVRPENMQPGNPEDIPAPQSNLERVPVYTSPEMQLAFRLKNSGFTEEEAQQILGQIQSESQFTPQSEKMNYSPEGISKLSKQIDSVEDISPEEARKRFWSRNGRGKRDDRAIGDFLYGNRMGNEADEGFDYRGRGLIQLTGKSNYEAVGKRINVDLVNNPELANDPEIAQRIAVDYFLQRKIEGADLSTTRGATRAVGPADQSEEAIAERAANAASFENIYSRLADNDIQSKPPVTINLAAPNTTNFNNAGGGQDTQRQVVASAHTVQDRVSGYNSMSGLQPLY